jgi:hypothetical protein
MKSALDAKWPLPALGKRRKRSSTNLVVQEDVTGQHVVFIEYYQVNLKV